MADTLSFHSQITDPAIIDRYYEALLAKDPEFVGVFFVGVVTTSVFCISTCSARKPKKENVQFFSAYKDALAHGFRPCKMCKPTENAAAISNPLPEQVEKAIALVKNNPKQKITDQELSTQGISPSMLRRWFQTHYGITFQAFARMYRINNAYTELQQGKSTTNTALDAGYESLSGFGYTYKKLLGKSPRLFSENQVVQISRMNTPLGAMLLCATDKGICMLEFTNRKMLETEFQDIQKRLQMPILVGENQYIAQAKAELAEYFAGTRTQFSVALDTVGTDFQKAVWQSLLHIPYGSTISYLEQATSMQKPKAVRAVASANGYNKISIIIPCHRVIGSNGKLTGYGGGLERKKWLLDFEKQHTT